MKYLIKLLAFSLFTSLFIMSCDTNDVDDEAPSTSSINLTLSGDVTGNYSFNFAYFDQLSDQEFGEHFFLTGSFVDAGESDPELLISLVKPGSMVSATDYPVLDIQEGHEEFPEDHFHVTMSVNDPSTGDSFMGFSSGGTISFSNASSSRVEGTLNVEFMGIPTSGQGEPFTFVAQGDFDVSRVDIDPN